MNYILQPHFKTTRRLMMNNLKITSLLSQTNSFIVITLNPESNCTCREKNRFLFRWSTWTLPEQHILHWMYCFGKCWRFLERGWRKKKLSDSWTGCTRFILLNERQLDGYTWSGERLKIKQTTSRPDNVWPDMWKHMSDAAKKKAKQRWAIEKPKLDNARQLRGIFFLDRTMKISSSKWMPLVESWKFRCQQQYLAKYR